VRRHPPSHEPVEDLPYSVQAWTPVERFERVEAELLTDQQNDVRTSQRTSRERPPGDTHNAVLEWPQFGACLSHGRDEKRNEFFYL
jgi:hypothetical protein